MAILKSLKKGKRPTNPRFSIEKLPKKFDPNTDRPRRDGPKYTTMPVPTTGSLPTDLSLAVDDRGVPVFGGRDTPGASVPQFERKKDPESLRLQGGPRYTTMPVPDIGRPPPERTPLIPPMYGSSPATNQLASIYGGGPSLTSLVNPPRTDPGGQEDRDKLMEMQRQSFRRFLAPPPEETPPPGTTPPGTTPPGTTPPGVPPVLPPNLPGIPGIGIPGIGGIPSFPGIGGIPEMPNVDPIELEEKYGITIPDLEGIVGLPMIPEIPIQPPVIPQIDQIDLSGIQEQIDALSKKETPVFDPTGLQEQIDALSVRDIPTFDPSNIQAQIDALSDREMIETQAFDPSDIQAQIDALQGGIANLPTFDPTGLQEQIDALSVRDIPTFDPTGLQEQIDALSNREVPTFDPTGLQTQIAAMEKRLANIPMYDPMVSIPPKATPMPAMRGRRGKNLGGMVGMLPDD
jgi:hypothetical protein